MSKEKANVFNEKLSGSTPEVILETVAREFGSKIRFASSMGAEDQVITHMLAAINPRISVFTLDTGRMFAETYELIEKTQIRYDLPIDIIFPDALRVEEMVNLKGINLFYHSVENRKLCCGIRKIEPLQRALNGMDAWITGLRRQQSPTRTGMQVVEWDASNNMFKINPLLEWSEEQTWDYIKVNRIPYNTLHEKGFPSIGCQPCTRAVLTGQDVRSGRWWWENPETKECGLHARKTQ